MGRRAWMPAGWRDKLCEGPPAAGWQAATERRAMEGEERGMKSSYNAATWLVDRHVNAGEGGRVAFIHEDDQLTYEALQRDVFRAQHALKELAVRREER